MERKACDACGMKCCQVTASSISKGEDFNGVSFAAQNLDHFNRFKNMSKTFAGNSVNNVHATPLQGATFIGFRRVLISRSVNVGNITSGSNLTFGTLGLQ